jgi:lambda family phage portal protein
MFGDFVKANLRGISSGLGVSYHSLTSDLEGVSFSSIRSGTLEERDEWTLIQDWFSENFLDRVFDEFIKHALLFGQITLDNGSPLPLAKLDKFSAHTWQARRWEWVNPLQDIEADVVAITNNLKSPQSVAAKLGMDYEDLLIEIKNAADMRAAMGIQEPISAGQYAAAAGAAASASKTNTATA